ncbi:unnamed protein product [marine sediment metagenome]|uniref:Uncharacterized protein n=1 Tax=marine sediment metagenome TaxID=412755 RepID=X1PWL7_9ZZZZ
MAINRIIEAANSFFNISIPPFFEMLFSISTYFFYSSHNTLYVVFFLQLYMYMR